jgi:phosphoglycolate phosphatase
MSYKAVLFDLDGTLLDTLEDLAGSMNSVLQRHGFPQHPRDDYKYFVGDGVDMLAFRAMPEDKREQTIVDRCVADMRQEYGKRWMEKTRPYPGIPEMLDQLAERRIKMAIFSNKQDEFTQATVNRFLSNWRFEVVTGARPSAPKKPDPTVPLEIAHKVQIAPAAFLYVGDTNTDMQTANAAGMHAVGALWGFRQADELLSYGAKVLIKEPSELLHLL